MKVFAISDLHLSINNPKPMDIFGEVWDNYLAHIEQSWRENVQNDDVVLIAGDISWAMQLEEAMDDLRAIAALPGDMTVFIVSQRAASLQHADRIIVLDDGHMVGCGSHLELLARCPVYQEIYESQFKKPSELVKGGAPA